MSLSSGYHQIYNKAPWLLEEGIIRSSQKRQKYQRLYKGVCAGCGKEIKREVPPPVGKKLLCVDCYKKK